eukprot:6177256-Pleurochrysis_carterae.AAC.6
MSARLVRLSRQVLDGVNKSVVHMTKFSFFSLLTPFLLLDALTMLMLICIDPLIVIAPWELDLNGADRRSTRAGTRASVRAEHARAYTLTCARTHGRTHGRTLAHARTLARSHARAHAHTHTHACAHI